MHTFLICITTLISVSYAQKPVNINDIVDRQMADHNEMLTKFNYGLVNLEPITVNGAELSSGVQVGMNSLYRRGDCFAVRVGAYSVKYINRIGFRLLAVAFGNIKYRAETMSGLFVVRENTLQYDYTIHNGTNICRVVLDEYKFIEFDDVVFLSSSPTYNGVDVADLFEDDDGLLNLANEFAFKDKQAMEDHLQPLCNHSQPIEL